jgi:hypothetical protein
MKTTATPPPMVLTPQALKHLHDTPALEVPKKVDLILQVLKVDEVVHNPDKQVSAKIKQK